MHDVDAAALIAVGILNQEEIAFFIGQIQIVGVKRADLFLGDENIALIPMITVGRGIEDEALDTARSAVKNVNAVDEADLRIADAFFEIAGLDDFPRFPQSWLIAWSIRLSALALYA